MKKIVLFICCMSLLSSCSLFHTSELDDEKFEPVWDYDFNVGFFSTIDPIIYKEKVIYSGLDKKKTDFSANSTLEAFNREDGQIAWVWNEGIEESFGQFNYLGQNYIYNNILHISTGVDYAVNLDNGTTLDFFEQQRYGGQDFYGYKDKIYSVFFSADDFYSYIMYSPTKQYDWKVLATFEKNDTAWLAFDEALFNDKEPSLVYFPYSSWNSVSKSRELFVTIYDTEINSFTENIHFPIGLEDFSVDYPPILNEKNIFFSLGGYISCINIEKKDISWTRKTIGHSSRSGIMYADGVLFVNTEFQLYALDAETGRIIWQIDSSAGSRMIEDDGVVYYTDGIHLRGVDALTGEVLLEEDAPSYATDGGAFFQPVLTIDHENDRIYTASYTHAYCYPTLR